MVMAKFSNGISICPVAKALNRKRVPSSVKSSTLTNNFPTNSKKSCTAGMYKTAKARAICMIRPVMTTFQLMALRLLLNTQEIRMRTSIPSNPRRTEVNDKPFPSLAGSTLPRAASPLPLIGTPSCRKVTVSVVSVRMLSALISVSRTSCPDTPKYKAARNTSARVNVLLIQTHFKWIILICALCLFSG